MTERDHHEKASYRDSFGVDTTALVGLVDAYRGRKFCEEVDKLGALGGTEALQTLLQVNFEEGLPESLVSSRRKEFGSNESPVASRTSFLTFCWEAFQDKIMIILFILGLLSLVMGIFLGEHPVYDWIEGFAIILAVFIVILVAGLNDYKKEQKFQALQQLHKTRQNVHIFRDGRLVNKHPSELVVGDVLEISDGNVFPVDGLMIRANNVEVDESAITGETEKVKKVTFEESCSLKRDFCDKHTEASALESGKFQYEVPSPLVISGTTIAEGQCLMLAITVGEFTTERRIMSLALQKDEETPLEAKLNKITDLVSLVGLVFAGIAVIALFLRMFIELAVGELPADSERWRDSVDFIIIGITVLVLAIPEGLPLAVTISLAYSVIKMQQDHNLVKRMQACETMGGANEICSDKTGTLTMNNMSVIRFWVDGEILEAEYNNPFGAHPEFFFKLKEGISVSTHARIVEDKEFGSKTEIALLKMLVHWGHDDYLDLRARHLRNNAIVFPFSSLRKRSSIIISPEENSNSKRTYVLGASEIVLGSCTHFLSKIGEPKALDGPMRLSVISAMDGMAENGLRLVCLAYRDLPPDYDHSQVTPEGYPLIETEHLTCIAVIAIADRVRPGVHIAVENCRKAHIRVRMITGDNLITAKAIARECGILSQEHRVMDGSEFTRIVGTLVCKKCRTKTCECPRGGTKARVDTVERLEEFTKIIDDIEVLARSQPEHKHLLVAGLMELGNVVAVTGDGTNDAPALKKADVGFAMGITGTEHAREAADIILLDDNFASIVSAVKWGRNIFDNIKKFLQFQLTVNVVAVTVAIVGAVTIKESPLTAVQILWVNLIMDTFAALALATEEPTDELLNRYPHGRNEAIVTPRMWKSILGHAVLQCTVIFTMFYAGEWFLLEDGDLSEDSVQVNPESRHFVISGRKFEFDGSADYKDDLDDPDIGPSRHLTMIFNTFVLFQLFNELNCRFLDNEVNLFKGLLRNFMFQVIWVATLVVQALMVSFGGIATSCHLRGLTAAQWTICVGLGLLSIPWRYVLMLVPDHCFNKLAQVGNQNLGVHRISSSLRRNPGSITRANIH